MDGARLQSLQVTFQNSNRAPPISLEEGTPLSVAVIECIAEADGSDFETRPPLYEAIDPEALDNLFRDHTNGEVTFTYLDYEITVTNDAVTTTRRREDPPVSAD